MEEKVYVLLEKMYKEFTDFKKETREEFIKVNQSLARIEQDQGEKIRRLCLKGQSDQRP
jgi:hypothetical protein